MKNRIVLLLVASFIVLNAWTLATAQLNRSMALLALPGDKVYIFNGSQYTRYNKKNKAADPGYPKPITEKSWPGLIWKNGIDAAVSWGNGKAYFFKGDQYIRYDAKNHKAEPGYPKRISSKTWPGVWSSGIDAVINWGNGKLYFFKGNEYIRYDIHQRRADPGYPKRITPQSWPGLVWGGNIDAAVNWGNGKAFFFKGQEYIRYDLQKDKADPGYPKRLSNKTFRGVKW